MDSVFSVVVVESSSRLTLSNSPLSRDDVEGRCEVSSGEFGWFVSDSSCFSSPLLSAVGISGTFSAELGFDGERCLVNDRVLSIPSIVGAGSVAAVSFASSNVSYQRTID